ncbi:XTP/dITP diphosphatase [Glaciecola petra]|uniref:dITP/XTP pyrophosphatase n=1 Tax=Glaciecola petra TaxID=3075602 RepID=A0ABU2ZUH7_9ALTE|nr:XTP/dITP diphosphatase [Aestuariibacter sp. P117]MDT0595916.1 XTP/dITP diphosphatase [Aestuariibacter sp. P117]
MLASNMQKIVLATGNKGKVKEFSELFADYQIDIAPQSEFEVPDVPETGTTFVENAIIKARHAATLTGLPAIADDSGLVVDALNGEPGIYSARYAGEHGNDGANSHKVLAALQGNPLRTAKFLCVLVFMRNASDPSPVICQGEWHGSIAHAPCGEGGFGYDPIFYVPEHNATAAELGKDIKNTISHRGQALKLLMQSMQDLKLI